MIFFLLSIISDGLTSDTSVFRLLVSNLMELGVSTHYYVVLNGEIDQYMMKIGF